MSSTWKIRHLGVRDPRNEGSKQNTNNDGSVDFALHKDTCVCVCVCIRARDRHGERQREMKVANSTPTKMAKSILHFIRTFMCVYGGGGGTLWVRVWVGGGGVCFWVVCKYTYTWCSMTLRVEVCSHMHVSVYLCVWHKQSLSHAHPRAHIYEQRCLHLQKLYMDCSWM